MLLSRKIASASAPAPARRRATLGPAPRAAAGGERIGKADLVESLVAALPEMTKKDAGAAVDVVFDSIAGALERGGEAAIAGFGSFKVGDRAAREGRNPRTGESIPIAASKAPKFSAGKALKDRVNGVSAAAGAAAKPAAAGAAAGRKTTTARAPTASASAGRKTTARRSTTAKSQ